MSIYQRGRIWHYDFEEGGKRHHGTTKQTNKREATRFVERLRTEMRDRKTGNQTASRTLAQVVDMYEAARLPVLKGETLRHPHMRLIKHLGGSTKFHDITTADLNRMVSTRQAEGTPANTLRMDVGRFKALAIWLEAEQPHILTPRIKKVRLPGRTHKIRILNTVEEENALLDALAGLDDQRGYRLALLMLDTGMRYGEATTLTWDTIYWEAEKATIWRSKTDSLSTIPLTHRSLALLREIRRETPQSEVHVFPSLVGTRESKSMVKGIHLSGINAAHIIQRYGKFTPHSFRHTYGTRLIRAGLSPVVVQRMMGHTNLNTTMGYVHLAQEDGIDDVRDALNAQAAGPDRSPNVHRLYEVKFA